MGQLKGIEESSVSVPLYIIRDEPLIVNGEYAQGAFQIPIATRERPLPISIKRGCKIIRHGGGVETQVYQDGMTRAPVFYTPSSEHALQLHEWIVEHERELVNVAEGTTNYGVVTSLEPLVDVENVFLRMKMQTGDAAGHNMTTKAGQAIADYITSQVEYASLGAVSGNLCIDKKPGEINILNGRGRSVYADLTITFEELSQAIRIGNGDDRRNLTVDEAKGLVDKVIRLNYVKNEIGSELAGSISRNAHHANIVAGMYIATGQDVANVVGGSLGKTKADYHMNEFRFGIEMPSLVVGTVGGGIVGSDVQSNLELLGCYGAGDPLGSNAKKLAEIIAGATLAGELSLMIALANGSEHIKAHMKFER